MYLQHAFNLSDEAVVARWVENPYYQHFTGETFVGKIVHWTVF
jgi:IS5 family transposase